MSIRKLVVAVTLVASGAAAHAGAMSGAGGKDVGKLTDTLFGSKMYTGLAVNATPATAPLVLDAPAAAPLVLDAPAAAPLVFDAPAAAPLVHEAPAAALVIEAAGPAFDPIVNVPAAAAPAAADIGGSVADVVAVPAAISPILITPANHEPTHVPEPASAALMLAGMVGVGALRRRKQQR